ncbi:MAG: DUF4271 domain-containing protein, partial [Muribaculaceae bacterium]|nr:DUF4271 domain-containing protein [Muribaculaceae bacterium]
PMPDTLKAISDTVAATARAAAPSHADSVLSMPRHAVPKAFDASLEHALDAGIEPVQLDMSAFESIVAEASAPPAWLSGEAAEPRTVHPASHSAVLGVLAMLFVACMLAFSHFGRALVASVQDLWSVRRRQNAFDESSPGRRRVQFLLALQFTAYCGVLLYAAVRPGPGTDAARALTDTLRLTLLAAGYYLFQLAAYATVGYAFASDSAKSRQWIDGFNASQGIAGMLLALPTLGIIFYPDAASGMLIAAATVYLTARLIFIGKGFRIFYTGPTSLVYFILYLCTLEIIPVLAVVALAHNLVTAV